MQGKQPSHHEAATSVAGRSPKHPEEQSRIQGVEENVGVVMSASIQFEELIIQSVRQPGERMPVRGIKSCERPLHRVPVKAGLDLEVANHIVAVIEVNERIMLHRMVERDGGDDEQQSQSKAPAFRQRLGASREVIAGASFAAEVNALLRFYGRMTRPRTSFAFYCSSLVAAAKHSRARAGSPRSV